MCYLNGVLRVVMLITAICVAQGATAQSLVPTTTPQDAATPALPDPLTPDTANALISRLSDSEVRALLLDQLNTQAAAQAEDPDVSQFFYHATTRAFAMITVAIERLPLLYIPARSRRFQISATSLGPTG